MLSLMRIIYFINCHSIAKEYLSLVHDFRKVKPILLGKQSQNQSYVDVQTEYLFKARIQIFIAHSNVDSIMTKIAIYFYLVWESIFLPWRYKNMIYSLSSKTKNVIFLNSIFHIANTCNLLPSYWISCLSIWCKVIQRFVGPFIQKIIIPKALMETYCTCRISSPITERHWIIICILTKFFSDSNGY